MADHGGEINSHRKDGTTGRMRMQNRTPETIVQVVARSGDEYLLGVSMDDYKIFSNNRLSYLYNDDAILRPSEGLSTTRPATAPNGKEGRQRPCVKR